ncbi:MAG: hypothetical protein XXXJIFNMEKO3_00610 [Candidatus Erwinia impunctatus]|nr:hypothetical protein XXXJIFNMEKO_00610 [Culicoides impunctatus]
MAINHSNQTRPKFTWRFLSVSTRHPESSPTVIYVNASSEQEARDIMPSTALIFAARLPFHAFNLITAGSGKEVRHA